jgi:hypothetical protein
MAKPKESSSKSNAPDSSSATNVPPDDRGSTLNTVTVTPDNAVPMYSDGFKEAWAAVYKELPQAHGAEKFLDKIGRSIVFPYPHDLQGVCIFRPMLTFIEKKMSKML